MPELLELPSTAFTPNTGREAGLRSAELRHKQAKENETLRALLASKPTTELVQPAKPVNEEVNRQIELANTLLAHAQEELKRMGDDAYGFCPECKRHGANAKDQAALIREIRGLMEHLCRLHNIAQAPTSKASSTPRQPRPRIEPQPVVEPTQEQPNPGQGV